MLADLGATVLKVERPGAGDVYRRQGPVFKEGESASFLTLNRGKRSIELDLGAATDRARLEELLGEADVLVENMRPGCAREVRARLRGGRAHATRASSTLDLGVRAGGAARPGRRLRH